MTGKAVELDSAQNYLRQIIVSPNALDRRGKGPLVAVLELLAQYVESTKRDIASLRQSDGEDDSFQDITGQRITKVVGAMQNIETKVVGLVRACGGAIQSQTAASDDGDDGKKLLNGPQLREKAKSQDEIDKLFESMG